MVPRRSVRLLAGSIALGCLIGALVPHLRAEERQRQVLVVYSARRDAQVAAVGERDLPRLLENGLHGRLDYYSEFIDPGRFSDASYQMALARFLRQKYADHRFDAIVAVGDSATGFVAAHRNDFAGAPPIVFYSTSRTSKHPADATGVIAELDLKATMTLASALQPDLRHAYIVSGADPGDRALEGLARRQLAGLPGIELNYLSGLPTHQLEQTLGQLPAHSMVFYLVVDQDGTGQYFHPLQYLDRVSAAANAPTYSWVDSALGHGIVGGSLKGQAAQMQAVAELTLRVLNGESADSVPIAVRDLNVLQVDWRELQRWRISESRVPPGTGILFREPSPWERYRSYILGALALLVAQSALIAGLLVQRRYRRKAEEQLLDSQAQLRASYDRIRDLGARLLNAQEGERSFIARELHDDVGQQLALIEMDVKLLGGGAESSLASEILERIQAVSRSLRELSHRLHPAKLRLIGLVVALKGLQSEIAQSGIDVQFQYDGVPATLPPDLTVCLFRVAQEALKNAAKYSGATKIMVTLTTEGTDLVLSIEDNGTGFDIPAQWGKGLGLVSMMERIEAIGGDLKIRSGAGSGTRLDATVPLDSQREGSVAV
jgi:signal transduction histidine kinase